jgi:hypothetical protein
MSKSARKLHARKRRGNRPADLIARIAQLHDAGPAVGQFQGIPVAQWTEQYRRIREAGRRLSKTLAEHIDKEGLRFSAQLLGILHGGIFVLNDEEEMSVLFDHAIHNYRPDGLNAVERLAKQSPPEDDSDEAAWLAGALRPYYSMFLIVDRLRGFGIQARDVISGEAVLIADISFSRSATLGLTLAARLFPMEGFHITSGTALPIVNERVFLEIGTYLGRTCPKVKDVRSLPPERALYLESFIIRTCLAAGAMERVRYEDG